MSSLLSTTWKMPAYLLVFVVLSLFVLVASANETLSQAQVSPLYQDHFISLVSVSSQGGQGAGFSIVPTISADGKMVAFNSFAPNLVANDTNLKQDVFVHDLQTGQTTRSSVSSQGIEGDDHSSNGSISADGDVVAFDSTATNLVGDDLNGSRDVFVHYRLTGETRRVSISSQREEANNTSFNTTLSANGRFVVFQSRATNLVIGDNNNRNDLFVHDLQTNQTTRLSVSSDGQEGNSDSRAPSISADGRFVAFYTDATNLVPDDNNNRADVVVHDRQTGETTRASVSSDGQEGNGSSLSPSISADGRFVAFWSDASNLVAADNNGQKDVFVHDRQTGETTRVSVSSDGQEANGKSDSPSISADGRFVAFRSDADSLVEANITTFEVLVHDRHTLKTALVSRSFQGRSSNADSGSPRISADGMRVAFDSHSVNLVPGDDNETTDVFVALNPLTYCNGLSATIVGTNGPDVLDGTNGNDVILGLGGNDIIRGFGGDDSICGDRGRDTIDGGADNDWISGGSGADRIHGGFGNDTIFGGSHADLILGGPGGDLIQGNSGADGIYAGSGDDIVYGNRGPDDLFGNEGVDMLFGNQGTDTLDCGPGTDIGDGGPGILDTADPNCELQAGIP